LLILAAAILATLPGWLPGRVFVNYDEASIAAQVATEYAAARLRQGEIPLWNPSAAVGAPLIGDGRTAVFFPTILLHMILPNTWAWTFSAVVRLWVAGFGALILARREGLTASLFAGLVFMLSGLCLGMLNTSAMNALPLLPWGMLIAAALYERVTALRFLGTTFFCLIVWLAGDGWASSAVLLASLTQVMGSFYNNPAGKGSAALLSIFGAAMSAWLLAAVYWMPGYYFRDEPFAVIGPSGRGAWMLWWVGLVPLVLAAAAVATGWKTRQVLFWLAMVVLSVLLYAAVPVHPKQFLALAVLAMAMLSARGLSMLIEKLNHWPWLVTKVSTTIMALAVVELLAMGIWKNRGSAAPSDELLAAVKWVESKRGQEGTASFRFAAEGPGAEAILGNLLAPAPVIPQRWERMREQLEPDLPRFVIENGVKSAPSTTQPASAADWKPVYPSTQPAGGVIVYENTAKPLPRVWVAQRAVWLNKFEEIIEQLKQPDFNPRETVMLDRMDDEQESSVLRRMPIQAGRPGLVNNVRLVEDSPERIRVATTGAGGWLILADAYAPGWKAKMSYVNYERAPRRGAASARTYERELELIPAYGALRAVPLQGGAEVVFEYAPEGWKKGLMVGGIGAMLLLILIGAAMFSETDQGRVGLAPPSVAAQPAEATATPTPAIKAP
jgi:hypothetical protein